MKNNPFVLPGFGQTGSMSENPILASMEMMRQAWEGLASTGNVDATAMGRLMSVEDMDKRISDLRAVENWLNMNLTMLRSTIQGLEVQRATLGTLKSFMETGMGAAAPGASGASEPGRTRGHSPLDEVLKSWPGPSAGSQQGGAAGQGSGASPDEAPGQAPGQAKSQPSSQNEAPPDADAADGAEAGPGADAASGQEDVLAAAASAAQGWWDIMQQQFQSLAAATAASAEGAMAEMQEAATQTAKQAAPGKASSTRKSAAKKATGVKTAAKKAAKASKATKSAQASRASRSTTAAKKAGKSPAARKTTR